MITINPKNFFLFLFIGFSIACTAQSVLSELEEIKEGKDVERLNDFFEEWHQSSLTFKQNLNPNDTIQLITSLIEEIISADTSYRFTVSGNHLDENKKYYIPQGHFLVEFYDSDWDIPNAEVVLEEIVQKRRKKFEIEKTYSLQELKSIGKHKYYYGLRTFVSDLQNRNRKTSTFLFPLETYPELKGHLEGLKVCYLFDEYLDFSTFVGHLNDYDGLALGKDDKLDYLKADSTHHENVEFIKELATVQTGFAQYPWSLGVQSVYFNHNLTKAMVYRILNCYSGAIPYFYERENGVWVNKGRYWDVQ